ncbi:UDP-GlcNAc:betaGal beta-1,3-N-acetylglucosaminyltransferase-like protein 1 [Sciurus carolinensis]|uniref:UDP-GlcNAc:betaGal beta-1,3-N-acetylglucosaminyltransferase-like protein 1 n=1 Tax=Sciurus carolinensis TaxID=30640 RepID=A0AA41MPV8_SCICA|nr:UDP-GlcNAc:betaGal beta-1,3-N-acetylglucosaminyltransferase-like protein 1 [Sciurus carolinensis]
MLCGVLNVTGKYPSNKDSVSSRLPNTTAHTATQQPSTQDSDTLFTERRTRTRCFTAVGLAAEFRSRLPPADEGVGLRPAKRAVQPGSRTRGWALQQGSVLRALNTRGKAEAPEAPPTARRSPAHPATLPDRSPTLQIDVSLSQSNAAQPPLRFPEQLAQAPSAEAGLRTGGAGGGCRVAMRRLGNPAGPGQPPLVSVILPVHNADLWLDECLESVLRQDFEGTMELSVFNDASKDKSMTIIEKWRPKLEGSGILVVVGGHDSPSPRGVGYSKNQAIAQSSGAYLCFLDSDDAMMPGRVRLQYEAAVQHPTSIIGCRVRRDPPGSTERYTRWINQLAPPQLLTQVFTAHGPTVIMPTWFCSRAWFSHVGPFDEGGQGVPEDLLFFYQHLRKGGGLLRVDQTLLLYRYHPRAATHSVLEADCPGLGLLRGQVSSGPGLGSAGWPGPASPALLGRPLPVCPAGRCVLRVVRDPGHLCPGLAPQGSLSGAVTCVLQALGLDAPFLQGSSPGWPQGPLAMGGGQRVGRTTIWTHRVRFLEERALPSWTSFTIWNAGRQGRRLYRSLTAASRQKVVAFCDVDENKIRKGFYCYEGAQERPKPRVPVLHFRAARPPFVLCVKLGSRVLTTAERAHAGAEAREVAAAARFCHLSVLAERASQLAPRAPGAMAPSLTASACCWPAVSGRTLFLQDLTGGEFEDNLRSLHLQEGRDFLHFS